MKGQTYYIEAADSLDGYATRWTPFRPGRDIDLPEAIELAKLLAAAPGSQRAWRVLRPDGITQVVLITGGSQ
jgi:hypothetical protein